MTSAKETRAKPALAAPESGGAWDEARRFNPATKIAGRLAATDPVHGGSAFRGCGLPIKSAEERGANRAPQRTVDGKIAVGA